MRLPHASRRLGRDRPEESRNVTRRLLSALLLTLALFAAPAGLRASAAGTDASRVVIVLAPYLTWDDVALGRVPAVAQLAERGAVANLNVIGAERPGVAEPVARGALTLSSGTFAMADRGAPPAKSVGEHYESQEVGAFYRRTTGWDADDHVVLYLGMPRTQRSSDEAEVEIVPGTLGEEVARAGGVTVALGNSDLGAVGEDIARERPAGIIAMDTRGRTDLGDVSSRLLTPADDAPFGVRSDLTGLREAYRRGLADVGSRKALVVLDPGDTVRAEAFADLATKGVGERQRERALRAVDAVAAFAAEELTDDDLLVVLSPVTGPESGTLGFAPVVVSGRGYSGVLRSSSTHRPGLVTLPDITAGILGELGLERPNQVLGNPFASQRDGRPLAERIGDLQGQAGVVVAVESGKPSVINGFIVGTVVLVVLCTALLLRLPRLDPRRRRRLIDVAQMLMLFDLAVPVGALLMFVVGLRPTNAGNAIALLLIASAVVWALALVVRRFRRGRLALAAACLAMAALLLLDQWFGAPFSFAGFFSYSTILGARYYGLGNEGASLLVAASLVGLGLLLDEFSDTTWAAPVRRYALPIIGALVVLTAAAPAIGANVGVVAWGTAAFVVAWALMNGRALTWRTFAFIGASVVVLVAALSLLDIGGAPVGQTHLARALTASGQEGLSPLWAIVSRKALLSARIFASTSWSYLLVAVLAFLAYVRWRPQGGFKTIFGENPHFAAALAACLFGSAASMVTEDSGIVMPALMVLYVGVGVLYLMLEREASAEDRADAGSVG